MANKKYTAFYANGKLDFTAQKHSTAKRKAQHRQREYGKLVSLLSYS